MRYFNMEGLCRPTTHYMVRLDDRLACIENTLVDRKKYFDEMPFFHSANLC